MELRSSHRHHEYKELQITLSGMGFYEEGMELQEMRQILDALQMSVTERETNFLECDMQQAIRESELDFMPSYNARVLNSTMVNNHRNISPCSSPEIPSHTVVVQAEVHHAMNWSPNKDRSPRKRLATSPSSADSEGISQQREIISNVLEPNAKRFHEIRGPVSIRRQDDSGVNMSNGDELPSTSYNTSNEISNSSSLNNEDGNDGQNRLQFSTSSAAMSDEQEYYEDDLFEHSEPSL